MDPLAGQDQGLHGLALAVSLLQHAAAAPSASAWQLLEDLLELDRLLVLQILAGEQYLQSHEPHEQRSQPVRPDDISYLKSCREGPLRCSSMAASGQSLELQ